MVVDMLKMLLHVTVISATLILIPEVLLLWGVPMLVSVYLGVSSTVGIAYICNRMLKYG
jgi:hypothetical protein